VWSEGNEGIERVKHVGFGCVLMDMRLVDAIDPPYFVFAPDGEHGLTTRGEDVYFCEKLLRDAGIPTHVDHNLSHEIGHVGEQVFGMAHAYTGRTVQAEIDAQRAAEEAAKAADVVTEAEAAGAAIAPDLANAVLEGADVPEAMPVRWAEADDGASWTPAEAQPEAAE
jgi:hypothetical protein